MKDDKGITLKEAIKLYYGEIDLTDTEKEEIDERLRKIEESGFLERCKEVARQSEKKRIHIGRLCISKVACMIFVICLSVALTGGIVYAAVLNHIRSIKVKDMGDHGELDIEYNDVSATGEDQEKNSALEVFNYYELAWIPDGYSTKSEYKQDMGYSVCLTDTYEHTILYRQSLPELNVHYSTENGKSEKVFFGKYKGEYIITEKCNYLIVTDGTYIYSIISSNIEKEEMIKMIKGEI